MHLAYRSIRKTKHSGSDSIHPASARSSKGALIVAPLPVSLNAALPGGTAHATTESARDKLKGLLKEEYHAQSTEYQPILLSSAAVSAAKDSHQKPTLRLVSGSSTVIRSFWKN